MFPVATDVYTCEGGKAGKEDLYVLNDTVNTRSFAQYLEFQ